MKQKVLNRGKAMFLAEKFGYGFYFGIEYERNTRRYESKSFLKGAGSSGSETYFFVFMSKHLYVVIYMYIHFTFSGHIICASFSNRSINFFCSLASLAAF
jgi:hypothetical protein